MKQFENFELDIANQCLWRSGTQVALPPKPFAVLRYLVENPGRLVTQDELLEALWPETYVMPQVLRTYVLELRKVLGDDAAQPRFIQTIPKRGYCFVSPVMDVAGSHLCQALGTAQGNAKGHAQSRTGGNLHDSAAPAVNAGQAMRAVANPHLAVLRDAGIVGRDDELERLRTAKDLAANGQRQVVFVTGEAGIGKTALVDAFLRPEGRPAREFVVRGQCIEGLGQREDYYPVMEALSQLCASPDGEIACRILSRMAPAWLAMMGRGAGGAATGTAPGDSLSGERMAGERIAGERMAGDLCSALEELAVQKPLLLVFEDLHWADVATIQLLSAVARRRASARLMVVGTYSPRNEAAENPLKGLKQDLVVRRLATEIAVGPLGKTAVRELLVRELKQEALPAGLAGFVHRNSEGNPLFVIAILEHLIVERFLMHDAQNHWEQRAPYQEMEAGVPDGLAQMIELEIERLKPEEQRMLEAGSLMSVAFPAWAVAAALEGDMAQAEESCEELSRRLHFVNRAGEDELPDGTRLAFYVFAHGLYREVLYQRQTPSTRAKRHVRVAQRLSELFAGREAIVAREMAMHYEAAGSWQRAAQALRTAARHASERQAHAEAVELLTHALRLAENLAESERGPALDAIREELRTVRVAGLDGVRLASRTASGSSAKA